MTSHTLSNWLPVMVCLLASVVGPSVAAAQTCETLELGDRVVVQFAEGGHQQKGRLVSMADGVLSFSRQGTVRHHPFSSIASVRVQCRTVELGPRDPGRGRTAGAIVGGLAGGLAGALLTRGDPGGAISAGAEQGLGALMGAGLGMAAGGLIGQLLGGRRGGRSWVEITPEAFESASSPRIRITPSAGGSWQLGLSLVVGT